MRSKSATLNVERLPLAKLLPHERNPRRHPDPGSPAWNILKKSIEHDYFDPMVWNKRNGKLVSGHLRRKVLEESGFTEADCVVVDYDEPTHLARLMAANKLQGEDDMASLKELIVTLDNGAFDMDLSGFDEKELERAINALPAEYPDLPLGKPSGMVWVLLGIELARYHLIQRAVSDLSKIDGLLVETNQHDDEFRQKAELAPRREG